MTEDTELLSQYAADRSESAFTELVQRHVDLIYSAALRLSDGDSHRAEDISQQVFTELARQSTRLVKHPALLGWLYTTTRRIALRTARTEQRRKWREQEANLMNELLRESTSEPDWECLRPVLEDAMHELGEKDRLAVLLRFFKNKSLKEVGDALSLSDNAARMRVDRALEKLRGCLGRRGVTLTAAVLAASLTTRTVAAAPAVFATTLSTTSLAAATIGSGATLSILKLMSLTKLQAGILTAILVAGVAIPLTIRHQNDTRQREQDQALREQAAAAARLAEMNETLTRQLTETRSKEQIQQAELMVLKRKPALEPPPSAPSPLPAALPASQKQPAGIASSTNGGAAFAHQLDTPTVPVTPLDNLTNVGNASPDSAFQTMVWAAKTRNPDALAQCVVWDADVKSKVETLFAAAPEEIQKKFGSVDGVLLEILAGDTLANRLTNMGVETRKIEGDEGTVTEQHQYVNGTTWQNTWPIHRFDDGWHIYIMNHPKVFNAMTHLLTPDEPPVENPQ